MCEPRAQYLPVVAYGLTRSRSCAAQRPTVKNISLSQSQEHPAENGEAAGSPNSPLTPRCKRRRIEKERLEYLSHTEETRDSGDGEAGERWSCEAPPEAHQVWRCRGAHQEASEQYRPCAYHGCLVRDAGASKDVAEYYHYQAADAYVEGHRATIHAPDRALMRGTCGQRPAGQRRRVGCGTVMLPRPAGRSPQAQHGPPNACSARCRCVALERHSLSNKASSTLNTIRTDSVTTRGSHGGALRRIGVDKRLSGRSTFGEVTGKNLQ
jgi:hypothetical protein